MLVRELAVHTYYTSSSTQKETQDNQTPLLDSTDKSMSLVMILMAKGAGAQPLLVQLVRNNGSTQTLLSQK